jgi:hypothetical protein
MHQHMSVPRLIGRLLGLAISLPVVFILLVSPVALANGYGGGYRRRRLRL